MTVQVKYDHAHLCAEKDAERTEKATVTTEWLAGQGGEPQVISAHSATTGSTKDFDHPVPVREESVMPRVSSLPQISLWHLVDSKYNCLVL